ncbi:hypothetical protein [Neptuniibacter halophilus]|uniref:hypothetical protein n=1 Tax=Neptuniibacter halophilus TaxID=651666 RepID=UPI0025727881|nr:hypothetical protein [Neptuniibacter halophilus]
MKQQVESDNYQGPDRRAQQGWHVDKTVSISHILTTLTIVVAGILYLADQDKRISQNTTAIQHNTTSIERQENRNSRSLDSINQKLDRLTELLIQRK